MGFISDFTKIAIICMLKFWWAGKNGFGVFQNLETKNYV